MLPFRNFKNRHPLPYYPGQHGRYHEQLLKRVPALVFYLSTCAVNKKNCRCDETLNGNWKSIGAFCLHWSQLDENGAFCLYWNQLDENGEIRMVGVFMFCSLFRLLIPYPLPPWWLVVRGRGIMAAGVLAISVQSASAVAVCGRCVV